MYNYPNYSNYQNNQMNYQQNPYNQNIYNPYDRTNSMQYQNIQPAQNQMSTGIQNGIVGCFLDSFDSITPNNVPMDGKPATFIKNDLSEIQLRAWNANGQIQTFVFKPYTEEVDNSKADTEKAEFNGFKTLEEVFNTNFAEMNERFDKLEKAITPKTVTRSKKEVNADD